MVFTSIVVCAASLAAAAVSDSILRTDVGGEGTAGTGNCPGDDAGAGVGVEGRPKSEAKGFGIRDEDDGTADVWDEVDVVVFPSGRAPGRGGRGGFGGIGARGGSGNIACPFRTLNCGYPGCEVRVVCGKGGSLRRAEERVVGSRREWKAGEEG